MAPLLTRRRKLLAIAASLPLLVAIGGSAHADPVGLLTFDEAQAPCYFANAPSLTSLAGVSFQGAVGRSGGEILHQCSKFGVRPVSGSNFLAFNADAGTHRLDWHRIEIIRPSVEQPGVRLQVAPGTRNPGAGLLIRTVDSAGTAREREVRWREDHGKWVTVRIPSPVAELRILHLDLAEPVTTFVLDDLQFADVSDS